MKLKKDILLWNYWTNFNQTLLKWSLGVPLSKLCPSGPSCIQDGRQLCLYSSNLGTFWFKIEQFWPFEEISIFSNGGHLGYKTVLTDTNLKGDHPRIISANLYLKKNLLLWNYWANLNQTLLKLSLGGPLSKLCPSAPSYIQDGRHY
jgi:hypothetical protein